MLCKNKVHLTDCPPKQQPKAHLQGGQGPKWQRCGLAAAAWRHSGCTGHFWLQRGGAAPASAPQGSVYEALPHAQLMDWDRGQGLGGGGREGFTGAVVMVCMCVCGDQETAACYKHGFGQVL